MGRPKKKITIQETVVRKEIPVEDVQVQESSFFDYLRFGESYTSLILGIIVVIISTALLLSFVHNKNSMATPSNSTTENTQKIAVQPNYQITSVPSLTPIPSGAEQVTPTKVTATNTPEKPTVTVQAAKVPSVVPTQVKSGEYVVKSGDTLWSIAEQKYKSGYNWVDIAKANNLRNPGMISAGTKLIVPQVTPKLITVVDQKTVQTADEQNNSTYIGKKIVNTSYTVVRGDTLWNIAQRAYGDGEKWVLIAKANNLVNPRVIHAGNVLKLPR